MLSRVTGLVRDVTIATLFGAEGVVDAFVVAFTIPNVLRRLVGEGALTIAFIPVFTEERRVRGEAAALALSRAAFTLAPLALAVVTLIGVAGAPAIVLAFAGGFDEAKLALTVTLTLSLMHADGVGAAGPEPSHTCGFGMVRIRQSTVHPHMFHRWSQFVH